MKHPVNTSKNRQRLSYLITVGKTHFIPLLTLLKTLNRKTKNPIYVVGNLTSEQRKAVHSSSIIYIDENDIDMSGRAPQVAWQTKYRDWPWYKQQFIRLCADRFIDSEQVVILDSEVFVFNNWDENRFYTQAGLPKCFYWTSKIRKPDWDYQMYRGAAYLYRELPDFKDVDEYSNSDRYRRHISGVVLFSTKNLRYIWNTLSEKTDLQKNIHCLFNETPELAFSDHDFYGIAMDYGLCDSAAKTALSNELLGWYDVHRDENFDLFANQNPMWSMCQRYRDYPTPDAYVAYVKAVAAKLGKRLPPHRFLQFF